MAYNFQYNYNYPMKMFQMLASNIHAHIINFCDWNSP